MSHNDLASTRAATFGQRLTGAAAALGLCWNVEVSFWVESVDGHDNEAMSNKGSPWTLGIVGTRGDAREGN